jgi:uncharacterized protein
MSKESFEWDIEKDIDNQLKHGVSFEEAQHVFNDPNRIFHEDLEHSKNEQRYYCFGKVNERIMTVRFTFRSSVFRIFGAGYWRKGRKIYEKEH